MTDIPKPTGKVLRRNPERECGLPIGQMVIKLHTMTEFQTVSFYCNKPRLHTDRCAFVGSEVEVCQVAKPIIINSPH